MNNEELNTSINNLASNEQLIVKKQKTSPKPPYMIIGNGLSTRVFGDDLVIDAFEIIGSLSSKQLEIFLYLKNCIIQKQLDARSNKIVDPEPNTIIMNKSKSDEDAQRIKSLMAENRNASNMIANGIMKKVKTGVYMINPYLIIPSDNFDNVAKQWNSI